MAVSTVAVAAAGGPADRVRISLLGVQLGQAVVAVAAVQAVGGEYATGLLRTTLTAMPRRIVVLSAKAVLLTGATVVAGTLAVAGCLLAGRLLLPAPVGAGVLLRAAGGSVLYLVLVALLAFGVGAAVRNPAAAAGSVLSLLYLTPVLMRLFTDPDLQRLVYRLAPATAGLGVQVTVGAAALPIGPWQGLAVTAAWATAALVAGAVAVARRDV